MAFNIFIDTDILLASELNTNFNNVPAINKESTPPPSAASRIYYDTDTNLWYYHTGSEWVIGNEGKV